MGDVKDAMREYRLWRERHVGSTDSRVFNAVCVTDAAIAQLQEANAALASKNVHLIAEAARSVKRAEAAEAVAESVIPPGPYCYSKTEPRPDGGIRLLDLCPYWSRRSDKPEQENGYCAYLGAGDWEEDGCGLLWDQVKECGVNEDE